MGEVGQTPLDGAGQPAGDRDEGGRQPGFPPGQMAAQLHDLRTVEAAKKEFEEYVRQQVSLACWEPGRPAGEEPGIGHEEPRRESGGRYLAPGQAPSSSITGCSHQAHFLCASGTARHHAEPPVGPEGHVAGPARGNLAVRREGADLRGPGG